MRFINGLLTPKFPSLDAVLRLHHNQVTEFGGSAGVRDLGLLESALAQPAASFAGEFLHLTIADQAAAYLYHLAKNHPFVDGNKRTAFAVMETFLAVNGYRLTLDNEQAYEMVLKVAAGALGKAELAAYLQGAIAPQAAAQVAPQSDEFAQAQS